MFKIGDIVEITAEADATGMLEFKSCKGYVVQDFRTAKAGVCWEQVYLCGEGNSSEGWYAASHFKLKEEAKIEKKECLFKVGQVVWDTSYGRGVVTYSTEVQAQVKFDSQKEGNIWFTQDGVYQLGTAAINRTLFFSEPKIEAATEPVFEPVLKKGDMVIVFSKDTHTGVTVGIVEQETEDSVKFGIGNGSYRKSGFVFYRTGEKIEFN